MNFKGRLEHLTSNCPLIFARFGLRNCVCRVVLDMYLVQGLQISDKILGYNFRLASRGSSRNQGSWENLKPNLHRLLGVWFEEHHLRPWD